MNFSLVDFWQFPSFQLAKYNKELNKKDVVIS